MLKIRDDVSLKELEKFGFTLTTDGYHWTNYDIDIYIDDQNIICFAMIHNLELIWIDIPNIIFDLIQANLVEKVVEE